MTQAISFKSFQAVKPPEFKGDVNPVAARIWLKELEKAFALTKVSEDLKTDDDSYFLKSDSNYWWESTRALEGEGTIPWTRFTELFLENYFPDCLQSQMEMEFLKLKQEDKSVIEYEAKFTELARIAPELTRKKEKFIWTEKCEESFQELKKRLVSAPVLALPDETGNFVIYSDASLKGLGCVLM
ncbi:uncharacterized protein LOC141674405 [Apium graveolens]|uniref:uncharacterized protein LOC141674405 n=1 Tax=Apium graveolens TaxID=4045 RepID=UPI003D7B1852